MESNQLRRSIGLPLLTFYGLGTILGAGVYVLIGQVVARAGSLAPASFLVAAVLAGMTAFSFAELSSRIPKSAGEAAYALEAFGKPWLAAAVGWAVVAVGTVSAATMVRGFVGYLDVFADLPAAAVVLGLVGVLAAVAIWGIGESLTAAAAITVIEIAGLLLVCTIAGDSLASFAGDRQSLLPGLDAAGAIGIVSGAFIAFYAFIGFEDIVNVAEEVRDATRNLPRAILISLFAATLLYILVAIVAVSAVPNESLATSDAPLALIVESRGFPPGIIAAISLLAVINGALVQIIMASRVLYGLASDGLAFRFLAVVNHRTRTPILGTLAVAAVLLALSLLASLGTLARVTSLIALSIFTVVNISLLLLKRNVEAKPDFCVPAIIPVAGTILCLGMICYEIFSTLL